MLYQEYRANSALERHTHILAGMDRDCSTPDPRSDSTTLPWSLGHTSHWDDIDCNTCPSGSAKSRVPPVHRGWLSR